MPNQDHAYAYINSYYNLNVKKDTRIIFDGKPGIVKGVVGPHLKIQLDGDQHCGAYHPTWRMAYDD